MSLVASDAVLPPAGPSAGRGMQALLLTSARHRLQYLVSLASLMRTCRSACHLLMQGADLRTMFIRHCLFFLWHKMVWRTRFTDDPRLQFHSVRYLLLSCPLPPSGPLALEVWFLLPVRRSFAERMRDTGCAFLYLGFLKALQCDTGGHQPRKGGSNLSVALNVRCRYAGSNELRPMFRITDGYNNDCVYLCLHCLADVLLKMGEIV